MKPALHRQRGAFVVIYALMLTLLLAFVGMALDLSLMYYRKLQLQNAADKIAVAAAHQLNGTAAGIGNAAARAQLIAQQAWVAGAPIAWDPSALSFSADPDAPDSGWQSAAVASASAATVRYARVDTAQLAAALRSVPATFIGALLPSAVAADLSAVAVAGKSRLGITPFAICAMSATPAAQRINPAATPVSEVVEYGFRHGVNYNLLQLNPAAGATSGELFRVNPIDAPGKPNVPSNTGDTVIAPFLCNGEVAYMSLAGGPLNLRRSSGSDLWNQLNSRFGIYSGSPACSTGGAPPDANVKSYAAPGWLPNAVTEVTAQAAPTGAGLPLQTIADLAPPLAATTPGNYGVLWAYGPARSYPANTPLSRTQMPSLYPGSPATTAPGYPLTAPYLNPGSSYQTAPTVPGRKGRRLMYIPLLSCPVAAGVQVQAPLLAVARFLLTAPATSTMVPGEFAGVVDPASLAHGVELYR
jgi:Flp pilus assembly protein TadG